jgi:hypothetical protein
MLQLVWVARIRLARSVVTGMLVQSKRNLAGWWRDLDSEDIGPVDDCSVTFLFSAGTLWGNEIDVGSVDDSNVTFLFSASTIKAAMQHPTMTLKTPDDSLLFPFFFSISILLLSFVSICRFVERRASLLRLENMLNARMGRNGDRERLQSSRRVLCLQVRDS